MVGTLEAGAGEVEAFVDAGKWVVEAADTWFVGALGAYVEEADDPLVVV